MGSKAERPNNSSSPRWRHSENQAATKHGRDMRRKVFGRMDEAVRTKERKEKKQQLEDEQFALDWIRKQSELNTEPKERFEQALEHNICSGIKDKKNVGLLFHNDDDFEAFGHRVDRFTFPAKGKIEPTKIIKSVSTID